MKRVVLILLLFFARETGRTQTPLPPAVHKKSIDKYKQRLLAAQDDSSRIDYLQHLNFDYETENSDSSLKYGMAALDLSRKVGNRQQEARSLNGLSGVLRQQGRFAEALEYLFEGRRLSEQIGFTHEIARSYRRTGMLYADLRDFSKAQDNDLQALALDLSIPKNGGSVMVDYMILADAFEKPGRFDSALYYANLALKNRAFQEGLIHAVFQTLGDLYAGRKMPDSALYYYAETLRASARYADFHQMSDAAYGMAILYDGMANRDSTLHYAMMALDFGRKISYKKSIMQSTALLARLYDSTDPRRALSFYKVSDAARDSIFGTDNIQLIQNLITREDKSRREAEEARVAYVNRIRWYVLLSGLVLLLLITWLLYRNNKQKQKANLQLRAQKEEVQGTLHQLKITQSQLIQAEKLASLGQLTSGIAHEIQNPLNFVTNFSELNEQLLVEAEEEIDRADPAAAKKILDDLRQNERRILLHGRRADAIVKSMLQHSQTGSGKKEPVDLNALCEQYFRIALQAMRAKGLAVQSTIHTRLDPAVGSYVCSPEEIGRVLLNLLENAFYAVLDTKKANPAGTDAGVRLITKSAPGKIQIIIEDDGQGIAEANTTKIFQPFFTTRSPGTGTGLGLSLSYDIITKGYQGQLAVSSREGIGSVFTITLPV